MPALAPRFAPILPLVLLFGMGCFGPPPPRSPVVDVSTGQAGPAESGNAKQSAEDDGPLDLLKRIAAGDDEDGDGIADDVDKCPTHPEDFDAFADEDGCPDGDNDGDGISDVNDRCPNVPEVINGVQDEDGCPDADAHPAKRAFQEGVKRMQLGDYAGARNSFEESYRLEPHDNTLFNLAACAERQGDRPAACQYYRRWRSSPKGSTAPNSIPSLESCP